MRVAIIHSRYRSSQPSGENTVVDLQASALAGAGHDVRTIVADSDEIGRHPVSLARSAYDVACGTGKNPLSEVLKHEAEVVHVHNLFPNFSTEWMAECPVPIVSTLHNFRYCCAAGTLYRAGSPCNLCVSKNSWQAVKYRCYKDSAVASVPLAIRSAGGAANDRLLRDSSALVALSQRAKMIHFEVGVNQQKMRVVPNFAPYVDGRSTGDGGWIYAGRLAPEKGVLEVLDSWPIGVHLRIFGDGPLRAAVQAFCSTNSYLQYFGNVDQQVLRTEMESATGLIFPSRWAESATPMVYVEALAMGLPTIALAGNGAADDVSNGATGLVVSDWLELPRSIAEIVRNWSDYSGSAVRRFRSLYSEGAWVSAITQVYGDAIEGRI